MMENKPTLDKMPTIALRQLQAFAEISEIAENRLQEEIQLLNFSVGKSLSQETVLPSHVFLILKGECRLLGEEKGRLTTMLRHGPGSFIGLASLLRTEPCESVSASTNLLAAAIPDQLIVDLYLSEKSFRSWCNQNIWPSEIIALIKKQNESTAKDQGSTREKLIQSMQHAKILSGEELSNQDELKKASKDRKLFIASGNANKPIGTVLDPEKSIPKAKPPFNLRVISLSNEFNLHKVSTEKDNTFLSIPEAPEVPEKSGLELGQNDSNDGIKLIEGKGSLQETLACFEMVSAYFKLPFRRDAIDKMLRDNIRRGQKLNIQTCGHIFSNLGLHVVNAKVPAKMGTRLKTPCMLQWKEGFVVAISSNIKGVLIASPLHGKVHLSKNELEKAFPEGIELLTLERAADTPEQRFGPSWFFPALRRYRRVLLQVLAASFIVQLFSLANPLLIQVIIDKVISQRSMDTLQILGIGLIIVTLLEGTLGALRTFLFTQTTNRIDQRLGAEVIDHLLRLPLNYFERRPVGELGTRVAELEKIRNFLTGTALTTVIDAIFSVIYIAVMAIYSWVLTIVALIVIPIQVGITLLGAPLFRRQFRQSAEENAKTQSHLVEILTGIQTVKAQNVEMVSRWKWQDLYAKYIARSFEKTVTGTAVTSISQVLQKLSQLMVLWVGAAMVLQGKLTLGQLIAFRIISGYVTQPLLRLSTIWQQVQELRVSFERLGDVIDTPQEFNTLDQSKIPLPPIKGHVEFEGITFAFKKDSNPVLKNINTKVESGTFVGIVGQSGSGKSSLMKLLPRLYSPLMGKILIDGYDIDKVELYSLRRQIGIVPQDPLLFSGSVADNIALTNPEATSDEIILVAKQACAHEFIMELPLGYSTPVGERGGSLSGGQRQRIAIARTLLNNPRMLVLDEATSALDYDTEKKVCDNLVEAQKDSTVFFITHRLSTIRRADLILMMHQGSIVESGSHSSLMDKRGRYYALYRQQDSN